jgi:hypothetical protein
MQQLGPAESALERAALTYAYWTGETQPGMTTLLEVLHELPAEVIA